MEANEMIARFLAKHRHETYLASANAHINVHMLRVLNELEVAVKRAERLAEKAKSNNGVHTDE